MTLKLLYIEAGNEKISGSGVTSGGVLSCGDQLPVMEVQLLTAAATAEQKGVFQVQNDPPVGSFRQFESLQLCSVFSSSNVSSLSATVC